MISATIVLGILNILIICIIAVLGWLCKIFREDIRELKNQKFVTQKNMDDRFTAMEKQFIVELRAGSEKLALIVENINQKIELSHSNLLSEIKIFLAHKKNLP
jgi:hypothetical protein